MGGYLKSKRLPVPHGGGLAHSAPVASTSAAVDLNDVAERCVRLMNACACADRTRRLFREGSADSIASAAIDEAPVASTSKSKKRKAKGDPPPAKKPRAAKGKAKASDFVPTIEWPEHFKKLEQVFKVRFAAELRKTT
jgi:DEAD/DEAH box helicase domain-containing protein